VLVVTRLDRLARSTRDLLNTLAAITDKKAGFRSLGDTWADTTTPHGRLMLTVLDGLAEFERELIRARTGEGRERAKRRGVRFGRKPKLTPQQRSDLLRRLAEGEETRAELARRYNVHPSTISRLAAFRTTSYASISPSAARNCQRAANLMLKRYGEKALGESAARADELAAQDDHNGAAVWRRITDAVGQLANNTPPGPLH
jgi:DNA invertase Pin-like site-specific DNA recombinase